MDRVVFAPLLADRRIAAALAAFMGVQLALQKAGLPNWRCPIAAVLHIPCPGCGLTRACEALLHGKVAAAMGLHAFAPVFLAAGALLAAAALCGQAARKALAARVAGFEARSGITLWLLGTLVIYWGGRFLLDARAFLALSR